MKIKVSEASGDALDWMVAKAEGVDTSEGLTDDERYSTDWAQGGPIVEAEKIDLDFYKTECEASMRGDAFFKSSGPTPLIAAMRCYVASKLGDEVEVPNDLL